MSETDSDKRFSSTQKQELECLPRELPGIPQARLNKLFFTKYPVGIG
jgi:hypothetical protein